MNFYFFADIEVKANKEKQYHEYWFPRGVKSHLDKGGEHVATFKVISGADSTTHVKRLFKITDLNAWAKGEAQTILSDQWADLAYNVKVTLLAPEPYSHLR